MKKRILLLFLLVSVSKLFSQTIDPLRTVDAEKQELIERVNAIQFTKEPFDFSSIGAENELQQKIESLSIVG